MVQEKEKTTKTLTLIVCAVALVLCVLPDIGDGIGLCVGGDFLNRFIYHFFHASFIHAIVNIWCLLSIVFVFDIKLGMLVSSFIIASSFPVDVAYEWLPLTDNLLIPTIGLSGVCYALLGRISFMVQRKLYYQGWLIFYIAIGFMFSNINGWLHLYCYLLGLFVGFLKAPLFK